MKDGGGKIKTPAVTVREIVLYGLLGALMAAAQVAFSFLPNIEPVSLLLTVYTLTLGKRALYPLYVFVLLEGLIFGFGLWVVNYCYVWLVLFIAAYIFRKSESPLFFAIIAAIFGMLFGTLCSIPYFFIGGAETGIAYIVSGLPFDLAHCAGNFVTVLCLFRPAMRGMEYIAKSRRL